MRTRRTWLREGEGGLLWITDVGGTLIASSQLPCDSEGVGWELTRSERIAWRLARRPPKPGSRASAPPAPSVGVTKGTSVGVTKG